MREFLEQLFPNRELDLGTDAAPDQRAIEDRSELALRLLADGSLFVERLVIADKIQSLIEKLRNHGDVNALTDMLSLCELVGKYAFALKFIKVYQPQEYNKFVSAMAAHNDSGQYDDLLWYIESGVDGTKASQLQVI